VQSEDQWQAETERAISLSWPSANYKILLWIRGKASFNYSKERENLKQASPENHKQKHLESRNPYSGTPARPPTQRNSPQRAYGRGNRISRNWVIGKLKIKVSVSCHQKEIFVRRK